MNSLRKCREQAGLTQEQTAEYMGVNQSTVSQWESGDMNPRADRLPLLAQLYACTIDDLLQVVVAD